VCAPAPQLDARDLRHSVPTVADNGLIAMLTSWVAPTEPVNTPATHGRLHDEVG
jgi:hypothetical protein